MIRILINPRLNGIERDAFEVKLFFIILLEKRNNLFFADLCIRY